MFDINTINVQRGLPVEGRVVVEDTTTVWAPVTAAVIVPTILK